MPWIDRDSTCHISTCYLVLSHHFIHPVRNPFHPAGRPFFHSTTTTLQAFHYTTTSSRYLPPSPRYADVAPLAPYDIPLHLHTMSWKEPTDYEELAKTLTENFNILADEVQLLSDRKTILEHKLRFAHEQVSSPSFVSLVVKLPAPPLRMMLEHLALDLSYIPISKLPILFL